MYPGFWLWEARSVVFYEGLKIWEARFVLFYKGLKLWGAHLYVFYVSGRLSGDRMFNDAVKKGGSAKERPFSGPTPYLSFVRHPAPPEPQTLVKHVQMSLPESQTLVKHVQIEPPRASDPRKTRQIEPPRPRILNIFIKSSSDPAQVN